MRASKRNGARPTGRYCTVSDYQNRFLIIGFLALALPDMWPPKVCGGVEPEVGQGGGVRYRDLLTAAHRYRF